VPLGDTNANGRKMWEVQVQKTLNEQRPKAEYILLRSGQLVGTALMLFVKSSKIPQIKRVEGSVKKVSPQYV
jgi:synaptojanin